jgi:ADP-ribose pyrophosphatase YjhB (NUDIX family)
MKDKDWLFTSDEYICDLRTVAVLVQDGKILVQRERNGNEYALPGGHVKIGETLEDGLIRETLEEMGVRIECKHILWSEECFWEWNGKQAHNIAFYYLVELCEKLDIPDNGEFVSHKDNCNVVIGWMPIQKLKEITIYPEFLKEEIYRLDEPMKHFVSRG